MSDIIKPTIGQILGLHPLAIRPRIPPPARFGLGMAGRLHWQMIDRAGKVAREGEQHNLILDQGLDQIATTGILSYYADSTSGVSGANIAGYVAVGTGSTAPAITDTALVSELARTNATWQTFSLTKVSDGVFDLTTYFEFDYGQGNGNLTEWGTAWTGTAPGNLFSRALFLDGGGSPTTLTKTSAYKLRLTYTLEITVTPTTYTAGSFAVTNVGTITGNYALHNDRTASLADVNLISTLARGGVATTGGAPNWPGSGSMEVRPSDLSGTTYATSLTTYDYTRVADSVDTAAPAYTPGSFTRGGAVMKWGTTRGNITALALAVWGTHLYDSASFAEDDRIGYLFDFDAGLNIVKDNTHTLTVGLPSVSWGRT